FQISVGVQYQVKTHILLNCLKIFQVLGLGFLSIPNGIIAIVMVAQNGKFAVLGLQSGKDIFPRNHFLRFVVDHIPRKENDITFLLVDQVDAVGHLFIIVETATVYIGYLG